MESKRGHLCPRCNCVSFDNEWIEETAEFYSQFESEPVVINSFATDKEKNCYYACPACKKLSSHEDIQAVTVLFK